MNTEVEIFNIMKFGGGSMKSAEDVVRATNYFLQEKGDIMVVSAFSGRTNLLQEVATSRNGDRFYEEFLPFHKEMAKKLRVKGLGGFFKEQSLRFNKSLSALQKSDRGSREAEKFSADIISMGEDFAQMIIGFYLKTCIPSGKTLEIVDSRNVVVTDPNSFGYIGEDFDQESTERRVNVTFFDLKNKIYILQGYVAGKHTMQSTEVQTTLLKREGSDVTAMLVFISLTKALARSKDTSVRLTFVKTFGEDALIGQIGLGQLFVYMESQSRTVISRDILQIEDLGLGRYFTMVDFKVPQKAVTVIMEQMVIEMLSEGRKVSSNR